MDKTVNWRELEPGGGLDYLIAEKLGWQDIIISGFTQFGYGTSPDGAGTQPVPLYSRSVDAALQLVNGEDEFCLWLSMVWCATFDPKCDVQNAPEKERYERADTPALAICRAWLAWNDAKG